MKSLELAVKAERRRFEAVGAKLHGWGERDYELNGRREYTWLEVRRAFALWLVARSGTASGAVQCG